MKLTASNIILFIHPTEEKIGGPIIDSLTRKIAYAISTGQTDVVVCKTLHKGIADILTNIRTMGVHRCICGATSESADYKIGPDLYTNSLGAHYVAYHRKDVPQEDLDKIATLECPEDYQPEDLLSGY